MGLTKKRLLKLEQNARVTLTPVQRAIMLFWFNYDCNYYWDDEDLYYALRDVMADYPDPHPKPSRHFQLSSDDPIDEGIPF